MHAVRPLPTSRHWLAAPVAFFATMLALPVNAGISIPDDPLTSAARVAPNVMFVLDDSGSMTFTYMPDSVPNTSTPDVSDEAYTRNTIYYNPSIDYQPWTKADGNRMTGGTSFGSVYGDFNNVGGTTINLASGTSCANYDQNGTTKSVCGGTQTFYVPKDLTNTGATYLGDGKNYYRYQILTSGKVVRSEYVAYSSTNTPSTDFNGTLGTFASTGSGNSSATWSFIIPANATDLAVSTSGGSTSGSNRGADLFVRYNNSNVSTSNYTYRSRNNGNVESVTDSAPSAGNWYVGLYAQTGFTGTVTAKYSYSVIDGSLGCATTTSGSDWRGCTELTPTGRSVAAEKTNYATWFSYSRTRIKTAKAGASDAFKPLGSKSRLGFRTIWDRNTFNIPVKDGNDGRFVDNVDDPNTPTNESTTTRTTWYSRLHNAIGKNGTPLHGALQGAGEYFKDTSSDGPYGPQSGGDQYSCRQNFTILTTDGYWNNFTNFTSATFGNEDNTSGSTITGPKSQSYKYTAADPFKDGYSVTLGDVAMYYWKNDLRDSAGMINNVPTTESDPAFWQHMVTFGISIGLAGNKGWGSVDEVSPTPNWADPTDAEDADRIDDLLHAAVNGHGFFVSAANPDEFTRGLKAALATIAQRTSSYSNVATNAASLRTGGQVFNASYVSGIWTGAVKAWNLDGPGGKPGTQKWSATIPLWSSRKIYTYQGSGTTFPTSTQITSLDRAGGGPVNYPVTGLENANYLKGKQSLEGSNDGELRIRSSIMGDIVGSSPAYVEDTKTLYVGANDGMLHAFNAIDGKEQFAYVPGSINFNNLATLSRGDYTHKFFVDGPIVVSDRKLTPGKNLLAGALGRGGKGLYFLDVSNPSAFSTANVTKELSETANGNMGLVLGRPILAKIKAGNVPAAVFGNGINSSNDKAVLIVANLATGAVIGEIDTGVGSSSKPNGLSAPTGVVGPDGKTLAYVYAGDMQGNVWKFDIKDSNPGNWTKKLLFTATLNGDGTTIQPITSSVTVALDSSTYKRWVFFGTGSFLTIPDADIKTPLSQSMYGFVDSDTTVAYTDLKLRTIINTGQTQDGFPVRSFESKQDLPGTKKGWYVNLPGDGERIVQDAQMVSNILITASMLPTGDACEASGSGYINAVDAFTGTSAGKSFFDLDGDGDTSDTNVGGVPVGSVNFGVGMPTLPLFLDGRLIVGGTGGDNGGGEKPGTGGIVRKTWSRVSWREIKRD